MAWFTLTVVILFNFQYILGANDADQFGGELEITPSTFTGERYFGVYQVENTLNLSCILRNISDSEEIFMDWVYPITENNRAGLTVKHVSSTLLNLVIKNVSENDSGEYKCTAINMKSLWHSEKSIIINVKNKKGECSEMMFQCSCGMCIHKRYTCDGFKDCHNGEDELPSYCGPGDPCDHKLKCPDGRCIPYTWCCDLRKEENCTTILKHECCIPLEKLTHDIDSDIGYKEDEFYDWSFLQTTVYITIGCALAFTGMVLVIIIVIVTCRKHMRRSSRSSSANRRTVREARISPENYIHFYSLSVHSDYPDDYVTVNPLLVSYNIGNGIRFVGRPVDPPPYCEILRSPPVHGPPPPYMSRENLAIQRGERVTGKIGENPESQTLLNSQRQVSVISREVMERAERAALVNRGIFGSKSASSGRTASKPVARPY